MRVFPLQSSECHEKPLWFVYGVASFPSIICCQIDGVRHPKPVIWGWSTYRRQGRFRTLGRDLELWIKSLKQDMSYDLFEFYDDHEEALQRIRKLTTVKE